MSASMVSDDDNGNLYLYLYVLEMELELGMELELQWEMELELALDLELEMDLGAGRPLGLKPRNSRKIQLDLPKSAFWIKMAVRLRFALKNVLLEPFLEPLSKPEK